MAKLSRSVRPVEKVVVTEEDVFTLELSREEIETLAVVMAKIAGNPLTSPRKHTDAIAQELNRLGIHYYSVDAFDKASSRGGISFLEERD